MSPIARAFFGCQGKRNTKDDDDDADDAAAKMINYSHAWLVKMGDHGITHLFVSVRRESHPKTRLDR